MAYKTLLFVAFAAVYATDTNDLCPCNDMELKDVPLLWNLMKQLSVDVPDDEKSIYTVLPGELSPLIDCNCGENSRKKRKAVQTPENVPVSSENVKETEAVLHPLNFVKETKSRRVVDITCPLGMRRFGVTCVEEEYFDDY